VRVYKLAQKLLKDRREEKLNIEDILHYQKVPVAFSKMDRLMKILIK
jgi:hypothetical protein